MEPPIYVSSGGFSDLTSAEVVNHLASSALRHIELSGGRYSPSALRALRDLRGQVSLRLHNYFPPPEVPFVLNLASSDEEIATRSMAHVRESLRWAVELGSDVYSVHAGYRMDPHPRELGRLITDRVLSSRGAALERFVERVTVLSKEAEMLGVALLIENNVVSGENWVEFGADPFLMTTPDECVWVMQVTPDNVGLLLDVGHTKVSAQTLGFPGSTMLDHCREWTRAYHFSENDGTRDTNEPVTDDSWFWPHLSPHLDYFSLEVYGVSLPRLVDQVRLAQRKISYFAERRR